ncbi:FtsX-like permease family protein, partial [bacterium]|nr:FtsX-like permease family protein [bacterium]
EVGVRKVLGARKAMLIRQFLSESMIITLIALTIALALIEFLLPVFNQLTQKHLSLDWLNNTDALGWMVLFAILTGLLAGSYPAWYLSALNPTAILKGSPRRQGAMNFLRKGLVVFQFTISIALIIGTLMIHRQIDFIQNKSLGFDKDQRLIIPLRTAESQTTIAAFKNEILKNSECVSAGPTTSYPGIFTPNDLSFYKEGENMNSAVNMKFSYVDYGYIETLGCEVIHGRSFSESHSSDLEKGIVINESAARSMGWKPEEAVGQKIFSDWNKTVVAFEIVGIVRDFNHQSLYQEIRPYFFLLSHDVRYGYMMVHVNTQNFQPLLAFLETAWKKFNPGEPFEYGFLDQDIQKQYEADIRLASLINNFAEMAILIACLGLFGLASYTTEQRTKEIGIRKVLGASAASIVNMLSTEFVKLVVLANVIAWPLAYFVLNRWLEAFAYKASWDVFVFLIACATALLIAFVTVSGQALKAAMTNPSEVLKYE